MYAVVQVGVHQVKVSEGETVEINRVDGEDGKSIKLDKVLMYVNEGDIRIGQPYLSNVTVEAKVIKQTVLGPKTVAFKFRRRKNSASKKGHRQKLTAIHIAKITA
ncbi:MAG: 50S ribosomal protein L21 [Candidatus Omnitrophica bacterium]|nr:50S ribosomal protein L21 [Candidatus Omnitrophota bacterium]